MGDRGKTNLATVVIISEPSRERESLQLVLASNGQIGRVSLIADSANAAPGLAEVQPALVIILQALPAEAMLRFVQDVKAACPQSGCVVVAENDTYQQLLQSREPDAVFYRGFSTEHLFAVIDRLLTARQGQ